MFSTNGLHDVRDQTDVGSFEESATSRLRDSVITRRDIVQRGTEEGFRSVEYVQKRKIRTLQFWIQGHSLSVL